MPNKIISFRKLLHESGRPIIKPNIISNRPIKPINVQQKPTYIAPSSKPQSIVQPQAKQVLVINKPQPMQLPPMPPQLKKPQNVVKQNRPIIKPKITQRKHVGKVDLYVNKIKDLFGIGTNKILVMIAAGPSVNEVDLSPLKSNGKIDFMCINKPYKPVWPSKYWSFCDHTQYNRNQDCWNTYDGIILNSPNVTARRHNQIIIRSKPGRGFSSDITTGYFIGRSTTYASMQIALYMNYDKIFIFGIDMAEVNGTLHHYGVNPDVAPENRKPRFAIEAENYDWAGDHLPENIRKRFYFCSNYNPWPFTAKFNKLDHKTAVNEILQSIPQ